MKFAPLILCLMYFYSSPVKADGRFYKATDKITLTYQEFRTLTPANQEAWIKELRNFNRNVDLIIDGQRLTAKKPRYWSLFPWMNLKQVSPRLCTAFELMARVPAAEAADERCQVRKQVKAGLQQICIYCAGDNISGVNVCTPANDEPNVVAQKLIKGFDSKDYEGSRVGVDQMTLTKLVETTVDEGSAEFSTPVIRKATVVKKVVTPASSTPIAIDIGAAAKVEGLTPGAQVTTDTIKVSEAGPITVYERRDKEGTVTDQVGGKAKEPYHLRDLNDTGGLKSNDNLDVEEVTNTNRLACIYAGWAVKNESSCQPVTEKEILNAEGKRTVYSCKATPSEADGIPVVAGDNPDGKAIVMCNPVLFGLVNNKPICIARSKNATEECAKQAPSATDSLEFAKKNPKEYRTLTRRVDSLCQQDEDKLRKHFEKRGKNPSQVNNAIKDLSTTCVHLRTRMAELVEANKAASPAPGTR